MQLPGPQRLQACGRPALCGHDPGDPGPPAAAGRRDPAGRDVRSECCPAGPGLGRGGSLHGWCRRRESGVTARR
ncbi:hypothetical protein ACFFX0_13705 [Citricoccus parietis]|uniref:Uncharacterized protein n=1 Tax=Citricoccus parietis TaxID=592307 RepID=A0ABV5FZT3_9MICC